MEKFAAKRSSRSRGVRTRDEVGMRALNDALRSAFDAPGTVGFQRGHDPGSQPAHDDGAATGEADIATPGGASDATDHDHDSEAPEAMLGGAIRFKQSPVRLHPGEERRVSLIIDTERIHRGTSVAVQADPGLRCRLEGGSEVPDPNRSGWSRLSGSLRARVTVDPGQRLTVTARAGEHVAELEVLVVRHRVSGWVREIARKDEDALIEAHFDHEDGVVTVFEGRREFKALERAARAAGLPKARVRECLPYRMLEVEVAANAVYAWAAEQIVSRRLAGEGGVDGAEFAGAVRYEIQALRYRTHEKLIRTFLDPEVFDGGVRIVSAEPSGASAQTMLLVGD